MKDGDTGIFRGQLAAKCLDCFRRDGCMLFSSRHAGIELCLGPFKDEEDRTRKLEEDQRQEEEANRKVREAGLWKFNRKRLIEEYRVNKALCDLLGTFGDREDDD